MNLFPAIKELEKIKNYFLFDEDTKYKIQVLINELEYYHKNN